MLEIRLWKAMPKYPVKYLNILTKYLLEFGDSHGTGQIIERFESLLMGEILVQSQQFGIQVY